jgi:hypothetical protein
MPRGIPVSRSLVFVVKSGDVVVDWGDGRVQDVLQGEFRPYDEADFGRPASDADLEQLRKNGRIEAYDAYMVYIRTLPEAPSKTIE